MDDIRTLSRQDPDQFENCAQFLKWVSAPAVHLDGDQRKPHAPDGLAVTMDARRDHNFPAKVATRLRKRLTV